MDFDREKFIRKPTTTNSNHLQLASHDLQKK